jgi:hypothetical protein
MDIFDINYNKEEDGDLYAISIVESPANGFQFIAMNNKVEVKLASDAKKQILYGIVLRPEQLIYREFEDGTPFNLKFSKETIEKLSQDFMRKGYQLNSTFDHVGGYLDGTAVVEQWIVSDANNDKGNAIGLPVQEGDWVIGMKLSDKLWSEYIETGRAKGFSIDSFLDLRKVSMSLQINNKKTNKKEKMSLLKKLIKMFSEEAKLASIDIEGVGTLSADAFEVGNIVYQDVEGMMEPLANATFEYDEYKYVTDAEGVITEKTEMETEEEVEVVVETPAEEEVILEELPAELVGDIMVGTESIEEEVLKPVEEIDVEALRATIADLQSQLEILSKEKEAIISENIEMKEKLSNIPNSTKLKSNEVKMNKKVTTVDVLRNIIEKGKN